jgi:hypothetical protein
VVSRYSRCERCKRCILDIRRPDCPWYYSPRSHLRCPLLLYTPLRGRLHLALQRQVLSLQLRWDAHVLRLLDNTCLLKSLVPCSLLLPRESQRVEAFIRVDIRHLNAIAELGPISRHWQVGRATFID